MTKKINTNSFSRRYLYKIEQLNIDHKSRNDVICLLLTDVTLFAGDLGQSYDSNTTLSHYELNPTKGQTVLFVGDLSYADNYPNHDNVRWDTWGRFSERSVAYQPWIWTVGNHEIDFAPEIVSFQ
jgi:hypothetical protein